MMVPIVEAVLGEIKNESIKNRLEKGENENGQVDEVGTWRLSARNLSHFVNGAYIGTSE